ncbi:hypothetical protein BDV11DRAFT_56407 [Aspergillus similis]
MTGCLRPDTFLRTLVPGKSPKIDIVAIHGLNPKNKERHAERTWELNGKIWLRDFLPNQLPQARIMLFGYNSNVSIQSSSAGVREQAQNLLSRLWLERQVRILTFPGRTESHAPRAVRLGLSFSLPIVLVG